MIDLKKDDAQAAGSSSVRKAYRAPLLVEWGSLRDVTQTAGKTSTHTDGGKGKQNQRTS